MSLINQVLRDLDQRHAAAATMPAAVRAPAAERPHARWRLTLIVGAIALVTVGTAAAMAWAKAHMASPPGVTVAALSSPATAATPAPLPAPLPAPAPTSAASAAQIASAPVAMAASSAARPTTAAAPASAVIYVAAAPIVSAAAPTAAVQASAMAASQPAVRASAPIGESRIEKNLPARTAQERGEAEYQRGIAAHQAGQLDQAAVAYAAALKEDRTLSQARQALAGLMAGQGRSDEAKALLQEGLAITPGHAGLATLLGRMLAERGEWQPALDALNTAAIASPSAEDHALRAAVLQHLDRHPEAAEHFTAALRSTPSNSVWWMGLGISLAAQGHADSARQAFNRARSGGNLSAEVAAYVEQRLQQLQ